MNGRRTWLLTVVWLAVAVTQTFCQSDGTAGERPVSGPEWKTSMAAAFRDATKRDTKVLVVFGADWCQWCRRMEREFPSDPALVTLLETVAPVRVDIDDSEETAQKLGVSAIPQSRLYNQEGIELARVTGYLPPDRYRNWLKGGLEQKPAEDAPSLGELRIHRELDPYFRLESDGKLPDQQKWEELLGMAAGPQGETRTEALRLVHHWSPSLCAGLVKALENSRLRVRVAAAEALRRLGAPLEDYDPWARGEDRRVPPAVHEWLETREAGPPVPAPSPDAPEDGSSRTPWTPAQEADLALLTEGAEEQGAARDRLVAGGRALIPRLRELGRSLREIDAPAARRLDEIRFRILLPPETIRVFPDAPVGLTSQDSSRRIGTLGSILKERQGDLGPLLRETSCDPDPHFREVSARHALRVLGPEAMPLLAELLKDRDMNVRAVALRQLAGAEKEEAAKVIAGFLEGGADPETIVHAIHALLGPCSRTRMRSSWAGPSRRSSACTTWSPWSGRRSSGPSRRSPRGIPSWPRRSPRRWATRSTGARKGRSPPFAGSSRTRTLPSARRRWRCCSFSRGGAFSRTSMRACRIPIRRSGGWRWRCSAAAGSRGFPAEAGRLPRIPRSGIGSSPICPRRTTISDCRRRSP
ncbi:MAG: thioredoxin fold domain-containing protein [Planctomycetota bacterium]|jgi:thioredoxin-related protein